MKTALVAALMMALFTPPASTEAQNAPFVIIGKSDVLVWKNNLARKLERGLDHQERTARLANGPTGIAQVRFTRGGDGRAHDIDVFRQSSGKLMHMRTSRLIAGLRGIPEMPASHRANAVIQVNLVVAQSYSEMRRLNKTLVMWERERLAAGPGVRRVLAFNLSNR